MLTMMTDGRTPVANDESPEPLAAVEFDWKPIATYDLQSIVMLRSSMKQVLGTWGRREFEYQDDELVHLPLGLLQWGEILDGEFIPLPGFEPTEWAEVPNELIALLAQP
jgi:hypothetical protein